MRMKGIVMVAAMALAGANAQAARSTTPSRTGCQPVQVTQTDAHKPVTYHFAVTNTMDKPQMVESVRSSCACLKVMYNENGAEGGARRPAEPSDAIPPGGVLPLDVELNPAGMEGHVEKRVWVTLAPIGGSPGTARPTRIVTFDIAADVRLRLGFKPMDAAFGVIRRSDTDREIVAKLSGYAAEDVTLGAPFLAAKNAKDAKSDNKTELARLTGLERTNHPGNPVNPVKTNSLCLCASVLKEEVESVFDVRLAPDGKSIVAKFRDRNVLPGIYSETWTIPTSDKEIPEITFAVSARVADAVSVTPQVITVGWDEPVCSRMVMVRSHSRTGCQPVQGANALAARSTITAETKPRKWGDVKVTPRPLNGWRIDIENIDPREVRQFSKRPFLEVKTNLPGMESFEIPLRVMQNGGTE